MFGNKDWFYSLFVKNVNGVKSFFKVLLFLYVYGGGCCVGGG